MVVLSFFFCFVLVVLKSRVSVLFVGAFSGVGVCHDIFWGFRV